ncbi:peptidylprolyl isomerase [Alginatibacterium sediminis]|uniref:Peptidyl-prolyl cis-trans isomerase n=1 Tax=Alginatibacterium sediminis TaxID=2164068 RepID=A0A420E5I3_9ALTE|nr:FKBP-type peptidyl-prolyl cis-trans isomerase [Alginatibacterium sediminis]RKF12768.1 peptidylprolyl isomerase [Alginatibacterium sediminis]
MAKQKHRRNAKGSAGQNKNLAQNFIDKYCNKHEVEHSHSGLISRVIALPEIDDGSRANLKQRVEVNQRILLADGSVIDDSYKRALPERFHMNEAIEGLKEGIALMAVGSRYEFLIPPDLAWGKKGNGSGIGPNALMIVDVRLLKILD